MMGYEISVKFSCLMQMHGSGDVRGIQTQSYSIPIQEKNVIREFAEWIKTGI